MSTQPSSPKNAHNAKEHANKFKREASGASPKLNAHDQKEHDDKIRRESKGK